MHSTKFSSDKTTLFGACTEIHYTTNFELLRAPTALLTLDLQSRSRANTKPTTPKRTAKMMIGSFTSANRAKDPRFLHKTDRISNHTHRNSSKPPSEMNKPSPLEGPPNQLTSTPKPISNRAKKRLDQRDPQPQETNPAAAPTPEATNWELPRGTGPKP